MEDKIIVSRELRGFRKDGTRVRGVAKLHQLGDQKPYFSFTTNHGADLASLREAFPELSSYIGLHLSTSDGVPMHAVANAVYFAQEAKCEALASHLGITPERAESIIGRIACIPAECESIFKDRYVEILSESRADYERARRFRTPRAKNLLATLQELETDKGKAAIRRGVVRAQLQAFMESVVADLRSGWEKTARECTAWLQESGPHASLGFDSFDMWQPCARIDGKIREVSCDDHGDGWMIADGWRWYVFPDTDTAGEAAREYWADLAENDPEEFTCIVGKENLVQWAMGYSAGPGSAACSSLEEWLDLTATVPEEHFARYDGAEITIELNAAAMEACGFDYDDESDPEDSEDSGPNVHWFSVVAYRCE